MTSFNDRSVVKVIGDKTGRAIYFSRLPIPYSRGTRPPRKRVCLARGMSDCTFTRAKHLMQISFAPGLFAGKGRSAGATSGDGDGIPIGITEVDFTSIGVDTPEELENVL